MATKQQRDLAINELTRLMKEDSTKSEPIDIEIASDLLFITRFLTIKRIKLIRDSLINEAIQNNASNEVIDRLQNFFPYIDSL